MDIPTIIALSVYTLIYLYTFHMQRIEIKAMRSANETNKSIINSMKTMLDLMDVEKFRQYNDMREETAKGKLKSILSNDDKIKEMQKNITESSIKPIQEFYKEIMGNRHSELFHFTINVLRAMPDKEREKAIEYGLHFNKENVIKCLAEIESEENDNNS